VVADITATQMTLRAICPDVPEPKTVDFTGFGKAS
ncbi:GntR family transcriptional regulator, partial [Mesorhizobium sp. M8A.F.Ca.ET.197.01.1.1]